MSDLNLYDVYCSVTLLVEVEAKNEGEAERLAEDQLVKNGLYDIAVNVSDIKIEDVEEII